MLGKAYIQLVFILHFYVYRSLACMQATCISNVKRGLNNCGMLGVLLFVLGDWIWQSIA